MSWILGEEHPIYGEVVAMGCKDGDPYRMFKDKHGAVALIPLDILERSDDTDPMQ